MPPVKHSYFGASSSERWITCPGSVSLCAKAPVQKSTAFANEGTAAHELAEKSLLSKSMPINFYGEIIKVGDVDYIVDYDMIEAVTSYVEEVVKTSSPKYNPDVVDDFHVETKFNLKWFSGRDDMYGTCDACFPDTVHKTIHIFDLKYGAGKPVFAENNTQLMYYALGVLGKYGVFKEGQCTNFEKVVLHIVQPRCEESGASRWETTVKSLMEWGNKVLMAAVNEALSNNPSFNPNSSVCRWCSGKPMCKAYADSLSEASGISVYGSKEIVFPPVNTLTDTQIAKILEVLPAIKSYMTSVSEYALARALDGDIIRGYKLVRGRKGNRKWGDEKAVEDSFGEILGQSLYENKIKSPAQIEKLLKEKLGKGMNKSVLEPFVVQDEGNLVLVPETDKREAVVFTGKKEALEDFFGTEL